MKVSFKDKEIQLLLDDYQKLIGVRIAVYDNHFNQLYASPSVQSSFCENIRQNEFINKGCRTCDFNAFNYAKQTNNTYVYQCHLGLYEAVTPIYDQQVILGFVMIGQVLGEIDKTQQWKTIVRKFPEVLNESNITKELFSELKQMSHREIEAASRIMKACASSIWLQQIMDIERTPITMRIKRYVEEHYQEDIITERVCNDLHISKTTIYNYLKSEFDMSLSQYVNNIRLEQAQLMLGQKRNIQDGIKLNEAKERKLKISDIAKNVGFDDYNYFSRKYKEKYGITPSESQKNTLT